MEYIAQAKLPLLTERQQQQELRMAILLLRASPGRPTLWIRIWRETFDEVMENFTFAL